MFSVRNFHRRIFRVERGAVNISDDIIDTLGMGALIVFFILLSGGLCVLHEYSKSPSDYNDSDTGSDTFELTTNETTIGIGQSKYIVSEMANTKVIDAMTWSSSDTSVVTVNYMRDCDNNFVVLNGISEGNATVTASSCGCVRTVTVTVSAVAPANELKVYNPNSQSDRYALLEGDGFEDGVLALSFNYGGMPVISLCGYTKEMLSKSSENIGNARIDFKNVDITLKDTATNTVVAHEQWVPFDSDDDYESPIIIPEEQFTVEHPYSVDYSVTLKNDVNYHVTGTITYKTNDGTLDGTNMVPRSYAWKYGGNVYSFDIDFPYGLYSRYHNQNGDYVIGNDTYSRNSKVADYNPTFFCRSNVITSIIAKQVAQQYMRTYGEGVSLHDQQYADFLLAFAQICWTYEYDHNQYVGTTTTDDVDYWAFPMETIYSGIGDCEDTSILCATLFHDAGYKSGVYLIPKHAMLALHIDDYITPYMTQGDELMCYYQRGTNISFYGCESTAEYPSQIGCASTSLLCDEQGKRYSLSDTHLYVI